VSLLGIVMFDESTHPLRLACIAAIFAGMIGLHVLDGKV
jgi:multidrug transporter EmrE-like cation transporter